MGCNSSGCMTNTQSEIEVKLRSGNTLTQEIGIKRFENIEPNPLTFIKSNMDSTSRIQKQNVKEKFLEIEEEKIQLSKDSKDFHQLTEERGSQNRLGFEINLDDLQLRYGKTLEELDCEYDSILHNLGNARKNFSANHTPAQPYDSIEERILTTLTQWKIFVYDEIGKKTGEIKNLVSFGSTGKSFRIIHEVNAWKDVNLLRGFCDHTNIQIDNKFFKEVKSKIEAIGSLTIHVWIELQDSLSNLTVAVGLNLTKPSDKRLVEKFLGNSIEKDNIITWFDANTPVPIEYGFGIGADKNEIMVGFYFFDGPSNTNLGRSLTAFQAYGAELDRKIIEIFKTLPSEEYKVYFIVSPEGVQRVRMVINKLSESIENNMLDQLNSNHDLEAWRQFKKVFSSISTNSSYFLDYTNEGFELCCIAEVGGEITSRIYIEEH